MIHFVRTKGRGRGPGTPNFWKSEKKPVFKECSIMFAIADLKGVLGPPSAPVSLFLYGSGSNAHSKSSAFEELAVSAQKSPSRVWDRDEGVAERKGREKCFPDESNCFGSPAPKPNFNNHNHIFN